MSGCICSEAITTEGNDAQDFARTHLREIVTLPDEWTSLYRCDATGALWRYWFRHPEMHGGGSPTLSRITHEEAKRDFNVTDFDLS